MKEKIALATAFLLASSGVGLGHETEQRRPISVEQTVAEHNWYYDGIEKVENYLATRKTNSEGVFLGDMLPFPYVNSRLIELPTKDGVYIGYFVDFKGVNKVYNQKGAYLALDGFVPEEIVYTPDGKIDEAASTKEIKYPDGEIDFFVSTNVPRLHRNQLEVLLDEFDKGKYRDFDSEIPLRDHIQRNYHAALNVVAYRADIGGPVQQFVDRSHRFGGWHNHPLWGQSWFRTCWDFWGHHHHHDRFWSWHLHRNPYAFGHRRPIFYHPDGRRFIGNQVNRRDVTPPRQVPDDSTRIAIPRVQIPSEAPVYRGAQPRGREGTRIQRPERKPQRVDRPPTKPHVIQQAAPRGNQPASPRVRSTTTRRVQPNKSPPKPPRSSSKSVKSKKVEKK